MDVNEFDDSDVCEILTDPVFLVELWSWQRDDQGKTRNTELSTYLLTECDVRAALSWCEENEPARGGSDPTWGSFVLYAGTWTTLGSLHTMWLAGHAPEARQHPDSRGPSAMTFTV